MSNTKTLKREPLTQSDYYETAIEFIEDGDDNDVPYTNLNHYVECFIRNLHISARRDPYFIERNYELAFKLMTHFIDDRIDNG